MDISQIGAVERPSYRLRYTDSRGNSKVLYFTSMDAMQSAKMYLRKQGRDVKLEQLNPALVFDKEADMYFENSNKPKNQYLERSPFPVTKSVLHANPEKGRLEEGGNYRVKKVSKKSSVFYEPKEMPEFKGSRYMNGIGKPMLKSMKSMSLRGKKSTHNEIVETIALLAGGFVVGYMWTQNEIKKAYSK